MCSSPDSSFLASGIASPNCSEHFSYKEMWWESDVEMYVFHFFCWCELHQECKLCIWMCFLHGTNDLCGQTILKQAMNFQTFSAPKLAWSFMLLTLWIFVAAVPVLAVNDEGDLSCLLTEYLHCYIFYQLWREMRLKILVRLWCWATLWFCAGAALLEFGSRLNNTRGSLSNWNSSDSTPCRWTGVVCSSNLRVMSMYVCLHWILLPDL